MLKELLLLSSPDQLNSMLLYWGKGYCLYTNWIYSRMVSMNAIWSLQGRFLWRCLWRHLGWFSGWYPWWYSCAVVQCHDKFDWCSKVNNFTSFGCNRMFLYPLESAVNSLSKSIIVRDSWCIGSGVIASQSRVVLSRDDQVVIG